MIEVIDREDALVRACDAINNAKVTMNWQDADITPDAYAKLARSFRSLCHRRDHDWNASRIPFDRTSHRDKKRQASYG